METISACATVERRVWPHSMSSCHMSEEYANSPVTLRVPSGRSVDSPMPPLVCEPWVRLVGVPGACAVGPWSDRLSPGGRPRGGPRRGSSRSRCSGTGCRTAPRGCPRRTGCGLRSSSSSAATSRPGRAEAALDGAGVDERLLDRGEFGALAGLRVGAAWPATAGASWQVTCRRRRRRSRPRRAAWRSPRGPRRSRPRGPRPGRRRPGRSTPARRRGGPCRSRTRPARRRSWSPAGPCARAGRTAGSRPPTRRRPPADGR